MIDGAPVNIKDFGAVGDGVANDTAAIQAAIDSFGGNQVNLYIPAGIYKTTAALSVLGDLSTIFGDGDNSIIAPVGAINVFVIGNGVDGVNFGTFRDFSIASSDGLQIRGIWGRLLRQFHFVNIVMRTNTVGLKNFSIAGIQCDFSYSCNLTSVTVVGFIGKGFWLGQDPATVDNQCNDFTLTGCHAFVGTGIGYHIKGSGNSLLGCLAEACDGGGVQGNFVPGINISGGYYENNGATSGFSFYITEAQNAGGISNVFINNFDIAGSQCVVLDQIDNFTIIGCNFRVNGTGIGVELDTTVSNVYLIGNRNEGLTGTLYGGVSYPANARISDTFTRFTDLFTTDITTDAATKTVYIGRLSATPGDNTILKVRSRQNIDVFEVDTDAQSVALPVAGTGLTLTSPNGLVTKIVTIDNAGNIALL
jgi:hypothetical protein